MRRGGDSVEAARSPCRGDFRRLHGATRLAEEGLTIWGKLIVHRKPGGGRKVPMLRRRCLRIQAVVPAAGAEERFPRAGDRRGELCLHREPSRTLSKRERRWTLEKDLDVEESKS